MYALSASYAAEESSITHIQTRDDAETAVPVLREIARLVIDKLPTAGIYREVMKDMGGGRDSSSLCQASLFACLCRCPRRSCASPLSSSSPHLPPPLTALLSF